MKPKPKFDVILHKAAAKYLDKLDEQTKKKIVENIEKARLSLDADLLKKLTGDIWEFRTQYNGNKYRLLAFWDSDQQRDTLVIATHGFIKKVSKVPQQEIDKAKGIRKIYFENKKQNEKRTK